MLDLQMPVQSPLLMIYLRALRASKTDFGITDIVFPRVPLVASSRAKFRVAVDAHESICDSVVRITMFLQVRTITENLSAFIALEFLQ